MIKKAFFIKHFLQIQKGGIKTISKKLISTFLLFFQLPIYLISVPIFIIITLIKPWYLIRWNMLRASRIGHLAVNTELYCCEREANINFPKQKYKDFFYLSKYISNKHLEKMWCRSITILPRSLLIPIHRISSFFYFLLGRKNIHEIKNPANGYYDTHNLIDKLDPHINFTEDEEIKGKEVLEKMGLPKNAKFVCLIVRDAGYLNRYEKLARWNYHNFRDGDINRYVMAAEELASRGYYVFRMGINVKKSLKSSNNKIIDYANLEIRSDFMDIYLGAKCTFCISTACGFDAVPIIFRRPIAFVVVPLGLCFPSSKNFLILTKHHINRLNKKKLSISEIFLSNTGMAERDETFKNNDIELQENTPEEIRDLVIEMDDRIKDNWHETDEDTLLQKSFWYIFEKYMNNLNLNPEQYGKIKAKFSAKYLRNNKNWIN